MNIRVLFTFIGSPSAAESYDLPPLDLLTREEYVEERHDEGLRLDKEFARLLRDEDGRNKAGDVGGQVGEVVHRLHLQQLAEVQHQAQLAVPVDGGRGENEYILHCVRITLSYWFGGGQNYSCHAAQACSKLQ